MRGVPARVNVVTAAARLFLPLFVLGELRAGFAAGSRETSNAANLQRFLESPRVSVLMPDEGTTVHYARLFAELRQAGSAIPTNDLWVAALAVQHQLALCTSDAHFQRIPQLQLCHTIYTAEMHECSANANGVRSFSPGLRAARYPGDRDEEQDKPCKGFILRKVGTMGSTPSGLVRILFPLPRVARSSQPWAEG